MNQKKCPKCGENNPPEAVMCWACYTPLSGGAVASATAGPGGGPRGAGTGAVAADSGQGGVSIPSWAYAAGGIVLAIVVLMGAKILLFSGDSSAGTDTTATTSDTSGGTSGPFTSGGGGSRGTSGSSGSSGSSSSGPSSPSQQAPAQQDIPFNMIVSPNEQSPVGVLGIVPKAQTGPTQAAGMARFASTFYASSKGHTWSQLQVYVFADINAGNRFKDFQVRRKNWALDEDAFSSLNDVWPNTQAVVVFNGNRLSKVVYPQSDANFWHQLQ